MSNAVDTSQSRLGSLTTIGKARFAVFTLAILAIAVLNIVMTPFEVLAAGILGWFQSYGTHQVHDMAISAGLVFGLIVPALLLLYHPKSRVNTILAPVILVGLVAIMAVAANSPLATGFAISATLGVIALALHPAGRSVFRFERVESIDWRVAGLFAIGAIPLAVYGGFEMVRQFGTADEHALFVHYGAMAIVSLLVVLMGFMAIFRKRDWRFAIWTSGLLAGFLGIISAGFPAMPSSLGVVGGALLFLWAIALVASVQYTRRSVDDTVTEQPSPEGQTKSV